MTIIMIIIIITIIIIIVFIIITIIIITIIEFIEIINIIAIHLIMTNINCNDTNNEISNDIFRFLIKHVGSEQTEGFDETKPKFPIFEMRFALMHGD